MKILLINKFLYPKGGDTVAMLNTGKLLKSQGHQVLFWGMNHPLNPEYSHKDIFVSNIDFNQKATLGQQLNIAFRILYSVEAKEKIEKLIQLEKPDIVHLHNFAHQISPSILHIFKKYNIPTVMTMHDYKLVCASYKLLSKDKPCELCNNGNYYHCFLQGCVKFSKAKSLLNMIEMYLHHKILKIYNIINCFISPSIFLKDKLQAMGFNGKTIYLPNFFMPDEFKPLYNWNENSIVYFGRLSQEKGLFTLIKAVKKLPINLKIIGDGPIKKDLESYLKNESINNVILVGYKTGSDLKKAISMSMAVIVPSEWYENNPMSIIESFALGKPVIGARIGGIPELVIDNKTGLTFESGNADDLRSKIEYFLCNSNKIIKTGRTARSFIELAFNSDKHYKKLMGVYEQTIAQSPISRTE